MSRGGPAYRCCCRRISHTERGVATSPCSKSPLYRAQRAARLSRCLQPRERMARVCCACVSDVNAPLSPYFRRCWCAKKPRSPRRRLLIHTMRRRTLCRAKRYGIIVLCVRQACVSVRQRLSPAQRAPAATVVAVD